MATQCMFAKSLGFDPTLQRLKPTWSSYQVFWRVVCIIRLPCITLSTCNKLHSSFGKLGIFRNVHRTVYTYNNSTWAVAPEVKCTSVVFRADVLCLLAYLDNTLRPSLSQYNCHTLGISVCLHSPETPGYP